VNDYIDSRHLSCDLCILQEGTKMLFCEVVLVCNCDNLQTSV
jgi:hypothetical protein